MASIAVYTTDFAGADNMYDAPDANSAYFWPSAEHSAFHNTGYYQDYSNYSDYSEVQVNPADCYWAPAPAPATKSSSVLPCGLNLDDYSDFSSDDDSQPSTPAASKNLFTSNSTDDMASTDAASTDAASSAHASDESGESDAESVGTPKAKGHVYTRDALMLLRIAVGMCAQPPVSWTTESKDSEGNRGECEWRRAAELSQQAEKKGANAKLAPSPTSWVAQQRARAPTDGPSDEEVTRSVKSILNKLTVEKFDALYEKLITCGICSVAHIEMLVHEVFEKACVQHHFVEMYADLCVRIEEWHEGLGHGSSESFRRILLNQCQSSFEQSLQSPALGGNDEEEQMELAALHKKRVLGNIRLVGALLNRGQLAPRVMLSCAEELLSQASAPETLESLALLLTIVGPTFDDPSWPHHAKLCSIFDRVEGLTKDKAVPPRLRFLLRDLLDLRATTWADMKKVTKKEAGPMKIEEVHRQAAVEAAQPQLSKTPQNSATLKSSKKGADKSKQNEKQNEAKQAQKNKGSSTPVSEANTKRAEKKETKQAPPATPAKASRGRRNAPAPQPPASLAPASPKSDQAWSSVVSSPTSQPSKPLPAMPPGNFQLERPANLPFNLTSFHRELSDTMKELGSTRDTMAAVRRVKLQNVPVEHQSSEFSNILTRVAEERCGAVRRVSFAFAASLVGGAFDRHASAKGVKSFFEEVFDDLCEDVPRLPEILKAELVPTLRTALTAEKFDKLLPAALK